MPDDIMSTLKGVLGDDAEEKIQSVLSLLNNSSTTPENSEDIKVEDTEGPKNSLPNTIPSNLETLQYIGKLQGIVSEMGRANDARSTLLMSLKPYMRSERQKSIDNAIKLLNISKISGLFKI